MLSLLFFILIKIKPGFIEKLQQELRIAAYCVSHRPAISYRWRFATVFGKITGNISEILTKYYSALEIFQQKVVFVFV